MHPSQRPLSPTPTPGPGPRTEAGAEALQVAWPDPRRLAYRRTYRRRPRLERSREIFGYAKPCAPRFASSDPHRKGRNFSQGVTDVNEEQTTNLDPGATPTWHAALRRPARRCLPARRRVPARLPRRPRPPRPQCLRRPPHTRPDRHGFAPSASSVSPPPPRGCLDLRHVGPTQLWNLSRIGQHQDRARFLQVGRSDVRGRDHGLWQRPGRGQARHRQLQHRCHHDRRRARSPRSNRTMPRCLTWSTRWSRAASK